MLCKKRNKEAEQVIV